MAFASLQFLTARDAASPSPCVVFAPQPAITFPAAPAAGGASDRANPSRRAQAALGENEQARFIDNYSGIRISVKGKRFQVEGAILWNLINAAGERVGQAATLRGAGFCSVGLLAPDIQEAILEGRQAKGIHLDELTGAMPGAWEEQRRVFQAASPAASAR